MAVSPVCRDPPHFLVDLCHYANAAGGRRGGTRQCYRAPPHMAAAQPPMVAYRSVSRTGQFVAAGVAAHAGVFFSGVRAFRTRSFAPAPTGWNSPMTEPRFPKIRLILVGDELLSGRREDKHMAHLIGLLAERGLQLGGVEIVSDEQDEIAAVLERSFATRDIVFCCGGIGSTPDDRT